MMPIKPILPFGDPILRQKSDSITKFDSSIAEILDEMAGTLYATDGGAGLAAPQIGILKRLIVMDCGDGLIELINPEILETQDEQTGPEGCLSYPGHTGIVTRAAYVKIKSFNREGQEFLLEGEDLLARCIQHEIDHLNGILFIDQIQGDGLYNDETREKVSLEQVLHLSKGKLM